MDKLLPFYAWDSNQVIQLYAYSLNGNVTIIQLQSINAISINVIPIDTDYARPTSGIWKVMHIHRYNFTQWSEKADEGISVNVRMFGF